MKRSLLIASLMVPFLGFSQSSVKTQSVNRAGAVPNVRSSAVAVDKQADTANKTAVTPASSGAKRGQTPYNFVKIGSTYYDLQTNASIGRRVMLLPDGTVSAVWTTSDDQNFSNRGTGYNHYDGSSWLTVGNPTVRIENVRLGWPSIGLNAGKEWVMGHDAALGGFVKSNNSTIGSTSWTIGNSILTENQRRPIWGRVANSGNYFHCIASYSDSSAPGEPRAPKRKGVPAPMTYSRSTNGGTSWDIQHILLPGYDSSNVFDGGGDNYAIDVKDSIVVIVSGGVGEHVMMWKSTDNGSNFTMSIIDSFPFAPYKKNVLFDATPSNDGSLDIMIDHNYMSHVFWGVVRVNEADTSDNNSTFFPGTSMLGYWNEYTKKDVIIVDGNQFDRDGTDTLELSAGCWSNLDQTTGGVPSALKNANIFGVARLGNTGVIHSPSASVDANGNIYVTFSVPSEQDFDDNNVNRRNIYVLYSKDSGITWSAPQDLTQMDGTEEEFACVAKQANGFLHMIFQRDITAGTNLQSNSKTDNNHPVALNEIMYAAVPVDKILSNQIGFLQNVSVDDINKPKEVFVVAQNYPNPFDHQTNVLLWLNANSDVTVEITDINGKVISVQKFNNLDAGNQIITLDGSSLNSGIYLYTVSTGTYKVTRKMAVSK